MSKNVEKCPSRLWEKMVGNDWEKSLKGPNSSKSLPNCPKMSQNAHFRRIVVRTDLLFYLPTHLSPLPSDCLRRVVSGVAASPMSGSGIGSGGAGFGTPTLGVLHTPLGPAAHGGILNPLTLSHLPNQNLFNGQNRSSLSSRASNASSSRDNNPGKCFKRESKLIMCPRHITTRLAN